VLPARRRTYLTRSNRFTLTLTSPAAVADAYRELARIGREAGITALDEIEERNGQVSFTFSDLDRNWWEIAAA
jgi:predicted lactoylglutathione lyase